MSNVLVTGASGFIGTALTKKIIEKGNTVYALSRHPPVGSDNLIPLAGDIIETNLGLDQVPSEISACYHLAGIHTLRQEDTDGFIYNTNVIGTHNVLEFCVKYEIPKIYFTSTSYALDLNPYGRSKIRNDEEMAFYSQKYGLKTTIFKPSVVMGTKEYPYSGHFSQFAALLIKIHKRAEILRRGVEKTMRLPVLEPTFRIRGNPDGKLNMVPIDAVVDGITRITDPGIFWLTNPRPPSLRELADWLSEIVMVNIRIVEEFEPTPIESQFERLAAAFTPYLGGDDFPSDLKHCRPVINKRFIKWTVLNTLERLTGPGEM